MSLSDDENFFGAMEALAHVYLQAFAKMQSPCKQIELEAEALDSLWNILQAGKARISSDTTFNFLSKDQMLEHGLDNAFKERIDMATFARGTIVSQLDLAKIQQSLRDFERVFLQHSNDTEDEDEPEPLIETFLYLITITLALAAKKKVRSKKKITVANVQPFCNTKTIPAIGALKGGNLAPLIKLAAYLVNDNVLLSALHKDTLKNITAIIRHRLRGLGPLRDAESYSVALRDYQEDIEELYAGEQVQKFLDQDEVGPRKWLQNDVLKANYTRPDQPGEDKEDEEVIKEEKKDPRKKGGNESSKENRTVADKEDHENDRDNIQEDLESDEGRTPVGVVKHAVMGKEKQKASTPEANVEVNSDVYDAPEVTPKSVSMENTPNQKSKELATPSIKKKKASNEQPEELGSPSRNVRSRIAKPSYQLVPQRFGSEEFEGGDELPPPPPSKKRRVISEDAEAYVTDPEDENSSQSIDTEDINETQTHQRKANTTNKTCDSYGCARDGSGCNHGKPGKPGRPRRASVPESDTETGSPSAPKEPKERKKNRPWTSEEVSRLERLVNMPQFRHSSEAQKSKVRKRTIKWAALKKYDQDNSNILKHRTQVQLKDKHRDLNDDGEHYRQVKEINKKRQRPQTQFPLDSSRRL
ncbi:hypothetical protein BGZ82_003058 [Podila clonocystis]|nr:hypothetical protein BGZ82_003058 [Podila clonocystis]